MDTTKKPVPIGLEERSTEKDSRYRLTLAPTPKSADELIDDNWPQTDEESGVEVPVNEQSNLNQLMVKQ